MTLFRPAPAQAHSPTPVHTTRTRILELTTPHPRPTRPPPGPGGSRPRRAARRPRGRRADVSSRHRRRVGAVAHGGPGRRRRGALRRGAPRRLWIWRGSGGHQGGGSCQEAGLQLLRRQGPCRRFDARVPGDRAGDSPGAPPGHPGDWVPGRPAAGWVTGRFLCIQHLRPVAVCVWRPQLALPA